MLGLVSVFILYYNSLICEVPIYQAPPLGYIFSILTKKMVTLSTHDELCEKAISFFSSKFGTRPLVVACAPGRVNLIGEHTDYQEGYVFPAALDRNTVVALSLNDTGKYHIISDDLKKEVHWDCSPPSEAPEKPEWYSYIIGAIRIFCDVATIDFPKGFNLICMTTVPIGGGLSSSAALEVATATAMEAATGKFLDPLVKARDVCQKAEHVWAKVPCGLMDQAISVMGQAGHAMLFDCKNQTAVHAPIPSNVSILVVNSGVSHTLVSGEYSKRRDACAAAVATIKKMYPEINSLRDVTAEMLEKSRSLFADDITFVRATHVVHENTRAVDFAQALDVGDLIKAGKIMFEGHISLHDNYDVTVPETDAIVNIAREVGGVYGARMTGGGFGGSVCILVESDCASSAMKEIMDKYIPIFESHKNDSEEHVSRHTPIAFIAKPSQGARVYRHAV